MRIKKSPVPLYQDREALDPEMAANILNNHINIANARAYFDPLQHVSNLDAPSDDSASGSANVLPPFGRNGQLNDPEQLDSPEQQRSTPEPTSPTRNCATPTTEEHNSSQMTPKHRSPGFPRRPIKRERHMSELDDEEDPSSPNGASAIAGTSASLSQQSHAMPVPFSYSAFLPLAPRYNAQPFPPTGRASETDNISIYNRVAQWDSDQQRKLFRLLQMEHLLAQAAASNTANPPSVSGESSAGNISASNVSEGHGSPSSVGPDRQPRRIASPLRDLYRPLQTRTAENMAVGNLGNPEEQFKQLYELSDDPGRRIFLDELFTFMQSKGAPITRLPIMAKQVLDLYLLYKLVTERGGLVDVINKKLWQEIIKGLKLPSSITSAAFTLRTQYMKYIFPYECFKLNLSTHRELEIAIDGNKREGGRRASNNAYADVFPMVQNGSVRNGGPHHNPPYLGQHGPPMLPQDLGVGHLADYVRAANEVACLNLPSPLLALPPSTNDRLYSNGGPPHVPWNNNNNYPSNPTEPQIEPINLGVKVESPDSGASGVSGSPSDSTKGLVRPDPSDRPRKRLRCDNTNITFTKGVSHISVLDVSGDKNKLFVEVERCGVLYNGEISLREAS